MSQVGFEPTISAGERPQTYALDRAVTGTGSLVLLAARNEFSFCSVCAIGTFTIRIEKLVPIYITLRKVLKGETRLNSI